MAGQSPRPPSAGAGQAAPEIPYATKRNPLTGAASVHYKCRQCEAELHSPLSDAGQREECPHCGTGFIVPGSGDEAEEQRRERRKRKAEDDARRLKEAALKIEAHRSQQRAEFGHREAGRRRRRSLYPTATDKRFQDLTAPEMVNVIARGIVKGWLWVGITSAILWVVLLIVYVFIDAVIVV